MHALARTIYIRAKWKWLVINAKTENAYVKIDCIQNEGVTQFTRFKVVVPHNGNPFFAFETILSFAFTSPRNTHSSRIERAPFLIDTLVGCL